MVATAVLHDVNEVDAGAWPASWGAVRALMEGDRASILRCEASGTPFTVLTSSSRERGLDRVARVHRTLSSPLVADVIAQGEAGSDDYVAFDCDAVADLETLLAMPVAEGDALSPGAAVALVSALLDVIVEHHEAGLGPVGSLSWKNVMVGRDGRVWLVGLGLAPRDGAWGRGPLGGAIAAPEVLLGGRPSPASDVYAIHAALLSLLACTAVGFGDGSDAARRFEAESWLGLQQRVLAPCAASRLAEPRALRDAYETVLSGPLAPEPERLDAWLRARVEMFTAERRPRLVVDAARRTLTLDDKTVDLSRRGTHWRILHRLVEAHQRGSAVGADQLTRVGWPGDRCLAHAGRARLYVAMSTLRKMVLGDHLQKRDEGYFLSSALSIEIVDA